MKCAWESLLGILPLWLKNAVAQSGNDDLQEIRLRRDQPAQLIFKGKRTWLQHTVSEKDLELCINAASRYSPWNAATSAMGYLTAPGGHRIGICGEAVLREGTMTGVRTLSSLCIRVARDFPGIAGALAEYSGSILILGAPGWGKTTLLRDLIRQRAETETVSVVDEREELFPQGFQRGKQADVLSGCPKAQGILQMLRTMGPQSIAVDEITSPQDCDALRQAEHCGVSLLATAHAAGLEDLKSRELYREILPVFQYAVILRSDQTYQVERVVL